MNEQPPATRPARFVATIFLTFEVDDEDHAVSFAVAILPTPTDDRGRIIETIVETVERDE